MPQKEDDPIDLEKYAKDGKKVPENGKRFQIRIDNDKYLVEHAELTGTELLRLAGKNSEQYQIFFRLTGGEETEVLPNSSISLLGAGVERFLTKERVLVEITINNNKFSVAKGEYSVIHLKQIGSVPQDHILCLIKDAEPPIPLKDDALINIQGGEVFASHQPSGAAS